MKTSTFRPGVMLGIVLTLALSIAPHIANSQGMVMKMDGEGIESQPYILAELGAVVVFKDKKLEVMHVMDKKMRPKQYLSIDIQAGDILVMLNGSRLKTLDDLQSAMEDAKAGDKLKFGVRRDKEMRMLKFSKADPKSLPKMGGMTMDKGPDDGNINTNTNMKFEGDIAILQGSGIIANETDDGIFVGALLPGAKSHFGDVEVVQKDRIVKLQDKVITKLSELSEIYDEISVGDEVTFVLAHEKKEYSLKFIKRESKNEPVMKVIRD